VDLLLLDGKNADVHRRASRHAGIVGIYLSGTSGQQLTIRYGRQGDLVRLAPLLSGSRSRSAEAVVDTSVELLQWITSARPPGTAPTFHG
jgi:hypothetical protein